MISYCKDCNANICYSCEEHEKHETISLKDLKPNIEENTNLFKEMKMLINECIDICENYSENSEIFKKKESSKILKEKILEIGRAHV